MRILSPLLTIAAAANVSNDIDIGHHRIVGIVMVTKGDITDTDMIGIQGLVSGNQGQSNALYGPTNIVTSAGVATVLGVTGAEWEAAAANSIFHFLNDSIGDGLLALPVVRLALLVPATGAAGTNAASQVQAKLILEPHR